MRVLFVPSVFLGCLLSMFLWSSSSFAQARACTEIGCSNGLSFSVDPQYKWKNGVYDVFVALDLKTVRCRGELPLRSCEEGPSFWCDDSSVTILESGCALPDGPHAISGININDEPRKVIVRLTRNNKTIITRTIAPQYQTVLPNGAGCGPICRNASYHLLGIGTSSSE